jgi:hypothetical protein
MLKETVAPDQFVGEVVRSAIGMVGYVIAVACARSARRRTATLKIRQPATRPARRPSPLPSARGSRP